MDASVQSDSDADAEDVPPDSDDGSSSTISSSSSSSKPQRGAPLFILLQARIKMSNSDQRKLI